MPLMVNCLTFKKVPNISPRTNIDIVVSFDTGNVFSTTFATKEIHMNHGGVGRSTSCLTLPRAVRRNLIPLAIYAAKLLFHPEQKDDGDTYGDEDDPKVIKIHAKDLMMITLVVERESRLDNKDPMDYVYRVTVHDHFENAEGKGPTPSRIEDGSRILIKGPYDRTIDKAIVAFEDDLAVKLRARSWHTPNLTADALREALPKHRTLQGEVESFATWAGVNVLVVSQEEAAKMAKSEIIECDGEWVQPS